MTASLITVMVFASPATAIVNPQDQSTSEGGLKKLEEKLEQMAEDKLERKEIKLAMKEAMKLNYTQEEYQRLENLGEVIQKKYPKVKVIPVENIIIKKGLLKFDTPPVIKEGRTLIPVRALSESFGAKVNWEPLTKTVTIEKNGDHIVIQLDNQIATVKGKAITLDVPAEMMNHRTLVPLRFILESLGLKVDYDQEMGIIEIEEAGREDRTEQEQGVIPSEDEVVVMAEPSILQDVVITVTPGSSAPEDPVVVIHNSDN